MILAAHSLAATVNGIDVLVAVAFGALGYGLARFNTGGPR